MAFPTAVSSDFLASKPFIAGGNVYVIAKSGSSTLGAYKATDPTSSFTKQGTDPTVSNTIEGIAVAQSGSEIHVVTVDGTSSTTKAIKYHVFNTSSDSWTTSNETVTSHSVLFGSTSYPNLGIVVRSDGDVIVLYNGPTGASMGSDYDRVKYARREGGTWTVDVAVDNGGATSWYVIDAVAGSSDRSHFFFSNQSAGDAYQRTLTSANALETFPSSFDTTVTASQFTIVTDGISYDDAGTQKVWCPIISSTANTVDSALLSSADAPTVTSGSDITGATNAYVNTATGATTSFAADGTTLWHTFIQSSTNDIYTQSNADEAGWSTPASFYTGTVSSVWTNVYTRGSNIVLGIVFVESTVKYHEYTISTGGVTGTSSVTLGAATNSGDGDVFIAGTSSPTLATVQTSTDGDIAVQGESSTSLDAATNTTDGDVLVQGTSSTTLDSVTPSADGSVYWTGSSDVTLETVGTTADGSVAIQGTSSVELATVETTTDGDVLAQGTSTTSLDAATNSGDGDVFIQADSSTTLATITQDASGTVGAAPITGDSSVALDDVQATQSGSVSIAATQTVSLDAATNSATTSVFILGDSSSLLDDISPVGEGVVFILADSSVLLDTIQQSADGTIGDFISGESTVLLGTIEITASGQVFGVPDSVLQARGGGAPERRYKKRKQQPKQPFTIQVKPKEAPLPSREAIDRVANSLYKARTFLYISEPAKAPLIRKPPVQKQNEPDYDELIALLLLSM